MKGHAETAPEPAPHRLRSQAAGSQVCVRPAPPRVALQFGQQRTEPLRRGAAGIQRAAAQAGPVAGGQRRTRRGKELHVARVRLARRTGRAAEDAGSAHGGHEQAIVVAVPLVEGHEHLGARRKRWSHAPTVIQPHSPGYRKMNTELRRRHRRRGPRTSPTGLLCALAKVEILSTRAEPALPWESDGCLVVPAVFKTVVDPAGAGRGGFDSYPLRYEHTYTDRKANGKCVSDRPKSPTVLPTVTTTGRTVAVDSATPGRARLTRTAPRITVSPRNVQRDTVPDQQVPPVEDPRAWND